MSQNFQNLHNIFEQFVQNIVNKIEKCVQKSSARARLPCVEIRKTEPLKASFILLMYLQA